MRRSRPSRALPRRRDSRRTPDGWRAVKCRKTGHFVRSGVARSVARDDRPSGTRRTVHCARSHTHSRGAPSGSPTRIGRADATSHACWRARRVPRARRGGEDRLCRQFVRLRLRVRTRTSRSRSSRSREEVRDKRGAWVAVRAILDRGAVRIGSYEYLRSPSLAFRTRDGQGNFGDWGTWAKRASASTR